ncbi:MAG: D-alanyl-D-alanine carboxypeptidase [Ruminococcaceae bacterium]|nr:D-alanyl-D-alanine carboxypeptidase [Oscillospiraceae bacterium]
MFSFKNISSLLLALIMALTCLSACTYEMEQTGDSSASSEIASSQTASSQTDSSEISVESIESSASEEDPTVHKCVAVDDYFENVPYVGLYNADTLEPYYTEKATDNLYPASQTKLVTAQVAAKYGDLNEIIYVGSELNLVQPHSSLFGIRQGMSMTLEQMLYGLMLPSGNDAAYTIAVNIARKHSGNPSLSDTEAVEYFCGLMNDFCSEIGAHNSNFTNPEGWDDPYQYTTVEDLALITSKALENETIAKIMATPQIKFLVNSGETFNITNSNKLIKKSSAYYNPCVIGGKTGSTDLAGSCLVAVFEIEGVRYIAVADCCPDDSVRYTTVTKLIDLATQLQKTHRLGEFCINCEVSADSQE